MHENKHGFVEILHGFAQRLLMCYGSVNTSTGVTIYVLAPADAPSHG
jgi:hypothetical protein